jgi:F0F1-type ATP synthase membrane subunit c/vacuolar-type H+-ATPase subunit K
MKFLNARSVAALAIATSMGIGISGSAFATTTTTSTTSTTVAVNPIHSYHQALLTFEKDRMAINATFRHAVKVAHKTFATAMAHNKSAADRLAARNALTAAITAAITARTTALTTLGAPPVKPAHPGKG